MCGIAGFWGPGFQAADGGAVLRRMTDAIRHNGPDDEGQWLDPETGVIHEHRQRSIVDHAPEGYPPAAVAEWGLGGRRADGRPRTGQLRTPAPPTLP